VAKWLKHWTTDQGSQVPALLEKQGFFHLGVYSAQPKKVSRCILKVFSQEVCTASFGGDVKPLVPGDLV